MSEIAMLQNSFLTLSRSISVPVLQMENCFLTGERQGDYRHQWMIKLIHTEIILLHCPVCYEILFVSVIIHVQGSKTHLFWVSKSGIPTESLLKFLSVLGATSN
jgi:hypothetical protein